MVICTVAHGGGRPTGAPAEEHKARRRVQLADRAWRSDDGRMLIRIEAADLPGRTCGPGGSFPGYRNVHVGVQRRDRRNELLELHPGDAPSAVWTLQCSAVATSTGVDLKGPYIQGRPGGRFIYLSWGTVDAAGAFTLFRRAKLLFDAIGPEVLAAAVVSGRLVARLGLTDAKGHPVCAHVRPPLIDWSAAPAE
jgi:Family of unknown function (DUF5990)